MKWNIKLIVAIAAVCAISSVGQAQVVVGTEDFDSYLLGIWTDATANPDPWDNPDTASTTANILDSGGARGQELWLAMNLAGKYGAGIMFNMGMTGNVSRSITDYEMDVYLHTDDPATLVSLVNAGVVATLYNTDVPTEGTEIPIRDLAGYGNAISNGAVLSFAYDPGLVYVRWDKADHIDASIPTWRVEFTCGLGGSQGTTNQPITLIIDEIVVRYNEPPIVNPEGLPVGYQTTNDLTVIGTVYDAAEEVDVMELHLDGSMVAMTTNNAGGSATNIISYDALGLDAGVHTAAVKGYAGTNSVWHEWSFYVSGPPSPAETNPLALYNINIEGSTEVRVIATYPVTNGVIAAAPPFGANNWLNVAYPNPWWFGNVIEQVSDASGSGTLGDIEYEMLISSQYPGIYAVYDWGDPSEGNLAEFQLRAANTVWAGALGAPTEQHTDPPADMDFELRNLESALTYDLYLYYASPNAIGPAATTYTLTTGYAPSMASTLTGPQNSVYDGLNFTNNFVEGTNYVTITEITPLDGIIGFNLTGSITGGGLSALQLVARQPDKINPDIQSFDVSGGMVNLTWDSQDFISYNILGKSSLSDDFWTGISNNIPSAGTNTSVSVPESGGSAEFYKVETN